MQAVVGPSLSSSLEQIVEALLALVALQPLVALRADTLLCPLDVPRVEGTAKLKTADVTPLGPTSGKQNEHNNYNDHDTNN